MKVLYVIGILTMGMCITFPAQAYKYIFKNRSDKDAEVAFALQADIIANKVEKVMVPARGQTVMNIPEWYRAGLCINIGNMAIRFLPDTQFKTVYRTKDHAEFEHIVSTKTMPIDTGSGRTMMSPADTMKNDPNYAYYTTMPEYQCLDRTYEFTYHMQDNYPVLKVIVP